MTAPFRYPKKNRLITYTDGNGGQTGYTYDLRGNLTSIVTPEGNTEEYGYDAVGNILTVTNGMEETWHYQYDNLYRLVKQTSPMGAVETYTYDSHDVVTEVTDALGALTAYEVNANGQAEKQTLPNGGVYSYAYDAVQRLTSITTPLGYEINFTYSVGDDVIREEDNLNRTNLYSYDVLHNLTRVTDAEGGITTYAYDVRNNRTAMTNALGNAFRYAYDMTDRMVTVTDPEEKAASVVYDMVGNIESITTPGERTTSYTYDGNYNTLTVTNPKGYVYGYAYDRDDRLTGTTDPLGQTTSYRYDAANRITAYTDKMGLTERYTYDAHGNVLSATDTKGLVTNYTYDLKDRMTSVTDAQGSTAYYTYDVMGNLTGITDYLGRGTHYTYDLLGNLTSITDVSGRTERMTYDAAGRLTSYTSNSGDTVTYDYDKLNNLVEKAYENAAKDQAGEPVAYAYNALGERVAMYDSTGETEYTYDSLGRIIGVTTYRTAEEGQDGDAVTYTYDGADNLSAITYPDGAQVLYEYDLNDNLVKVTDREGLETTYVYDAINRITEIHRPNGISTYNTYNARDQIVELENICDDCGWVVSRYSYTYDERGFIVAETAVESLAGYAYDDKHSGKHEDGRHDSLYPHGTKHAKHDMDATFAYQIVETDRAFTYDDAGKILSATEKEDNYGTYVYDYEYDLMGNRTAVIKTDEDGTVVESEKYVYNESNQLVSVELYDGKKTTAVSYTYDEDGNLISEIGSDGTDKVERYYSYTVENRLEAVYDRQELLMAAAYDGDGNRVFQLNYNLHTDDDWKGNSGNGNGSNKDNSGNGNGNGNSNSTGNGNSTNVETDNSQNQSGILFPIDGQVSDTEEYLISLIKTSGKEMNYELIEYINDVNREYTEVLVEQNINGALDTAYVYGASIGTGSDRLSLDRFDGTSGYYLYDPRGSVTGITNEEGQIYQSYRYSATGEITFGAPQYENEYTYNGESYNPNIKSQYLRARYYYVVTATFLTEDSYLGDISKPLTLNRYNYCLSNYLNYADPSGHFWEFMSKAGDFILDVAETCGEVLGSFGRGALDTVRFPLAESLYNLNSLGSGLLYLWGLSDRSYTQVREENAANLDSFVRSEMDKVENITAYNVGKCVMTVALLVYGYKELKGAFSLAGKSALTLSGKTVIEGLEITAVVKALLSFESIKIAVSNIRFINSGNAGNFKAADKNEGGSGTSNSINLNNKPISHNQKLQNFIDSLYKGQGNPNQIGNGTTMDSIRYELRTGNPVEGRFHSQKGQEFLNGIKKLINSGILDAHDEEIAKALVQDIIAALSGHWTLIAISYAKWQCARQRVRYLTGGNPVWEGC